MTTLDETVRTEVYEMPLADAVKAAKEAAARAEKRGLAVPDRRIGRSGRPVFSGILRRDHSQ